MNHKLWPHNLLISIEWPVDIQFGLFSLSARHVSLHVNYVNTSSYKLCNNRCWWIRQWVIVYDSAHVKCYRHLLLRVLWDVAIIEKIKKNWKIEKVKISIIGSIFLDFGFFWIFRVFWKSQHLRVTLSVFYILLRLFL